MCKVSFILPVYNVEQYLERCVNSVEAQSVYAEIILVDDGSTDGSGEIADRLSLEKNNIRVIHQKNGGLSAARNTGLRAAKGEYVLFVDSDDWLIPNTVDKLVKIADEECLDIGVAGFQEVLEEDVHANPNVIRPISCETTDGKKYLLNSLREKYAHMMVWKSIYRRQFLIDNLLFFREGYNHEDEEWSPRAYINAHRVNSIDCVFYNYLIRGNGIARQPEELRKNSLDMVSNCYELKKTSETIDNKELKVLLDNNIAHLFLSAVYNGKLIDEEYRDVVNKDFFSGMLLSGKTKHKVQLFRFSKKLYYNINVATKMMQ